MKVCHTENVYAMNKSNKNADVQLWISIFFHSCTDLKLMTSLLFCKSAQQNTMPPSPPPQQKPTEREINIYKETEITKKIIKKCTHIKKNADRKWKNTQTKYPHKNQYKYICEIILQ